jgi:hypothetical protein
MTRSDPPVEERIPDVAAAKRCVDSIVEYMYHDDDSPFAAEDLRYSIKLLVEEAKNDTTTPDIHRTRVKS